MSEARKALMGKIQASIDGYTFTIDNPDLLDAEELELDQAASVQSNTELLEEQRLLQARTKTEADVQRLEEAKRKASSQAIKDKLDEEIKLIRNEKAKAEQEEEEEQAAITSEEQVRERIRAAVSGIQETAEGAAGRVMEVGRDAWDNLSNVATPGSIFLPVAILVIFFLILIPINGKSRIQWLWLALIGQAHLTGETAAGGSATGGSADFGGPAGGSADFAPSSYIPIIFTGPGEVV